MTEIEAGASEIFCSKPPAVVTTMVCNLVVSVCNVAFVLQLPGLVLVLKQLMLKALQRPKSIS